MDTDYTARLQTIPLFSGLKEKDLTYVNSIVKQVAYPAGQVILRQGEQGETFYIIDAGQVYVRRRDESGAEAVVRFLGPGQFFGETALLYDEPRSATVEATANTLLFFIEKDDFGAMVARLPAIKKQLEASSRRRSGLGRFEWQMPDEVVVGLASRNILPLIFESVGGLFFWLGIAGGMMAVSFLSNQRLWELLPVQWPLRIGALVVVGLVLAWHIVDWTNDFLVVTNRRVIHLERYGFLRETRNEIPIEAVQNVILTRKGLVDAVMKLADITVETIGGRLTFTHVAGAEHLQARILDQRTRVQQEARYEEQEAIRQELLRFLRPAPPAPPPASPAAPEAQPAASSSQSQAAPLSWRNWLRALRPKTRLEKPGEITWRKHWLLLIWRLILPIFLLLSGPAIVVVLLLLSRRSPGAPPAIWLVLPPLVLIAPALLWIWWRYAWWRGDEYILTTDRIVDIERHPLGLRETRRESTLDRIQDIEVSIVGIWARLFDLGDVLIKTAGGNFTFHAVADPRSVQRDIFHRLAAFRRRQQEQQRRLRFSEMARWLGVYYDLTTPVPMSSETEESLEE